MSSNLCEHGVYITDGVVHRLICDKDQNDCAFIYWCISERRLKMTQNYERCKNRNIDICEVIDNE